MFRVRKTFAAYSKCSLVSFSLSSLLASNPFSGLSLANSAILEFDTGGPEKARELTEMSQGWPSSRDPRENVQSTKSNDREFWGSRGDVESETQRWAREKRRQKGQPRGSPGGYDYGAPTRGQAPA